MEKLFCPRADARPLSARLDGQGSEGDIKHELFEVRATTLLCLREWLLKY